MIKGTTLCPSQPILKFLHVPFFFWVRNFAIDVIRFLN